MILHLQGPYLAGIDLSCDRMYSLGQKFLPSFEVGPVLSVLDSEHHFRIWR